jgi:hypothetical protein
MAVDIKVAPDEKLELVQTYITDTNSNSDYFNISELPDTFSGGKNAFLIAGTDKLLANTEIKIQIRDANDNLCYIEYANGSIPVYDPTDLTKILSYGDYYEGNSKVVAVYVYPNVTAFGPATITILGQLKDVPQEWNGLYSVKWTKQININPALANTTRVRFYKRPKVSITEILQPLYSFDITGSKVASLVTQSFASIKVNQLETFAGDVARVKVYRTSEGDISDYELIQDISIESKNLLTTYELSSSVVGNAGLFTNDSLSKLWNTSSLDAQLTSSVSIGIDNGLRLKGNGTLIYTSSLNLLSSNEYELQLDSFFTGSTANKLGIYVSYITQSTLAQTYTSTTPIAILNGITPTKNFGTQTFPFKVPFDYPTASLYLSQESGTTEWHVGNISLNLSQDTAFSPNEISFVTSMPTVLGNETFNFKFEFYDINNNYVPVAVTQSVLFNGGNNNIGGTLILISGSVLELSQSVAVTISDVTASVSQSFFTSSFYSASLQSSSLYISSSISKSLYTSSVSQSGYINLVSGSLNDSIVVVSGSTYTLSQSFVSASASFNSRISESVYTTSYQVYSASAFLDKFIFTDENGKLNKTPTTGSENGLFLGSTYLGYYSGSSWKTYMDNQGDFYLTGSNDNFLAWSGQLGTLQVQGVINIQGGNAATTSSVATAAANAVTSGSNSATAVSNSLAPNIFTNANGLINRPPAVLVGSPAGLYLSPSYLGYYTGSNWNTYMGNDGKFFLTGSATNYLKWDGSTLNIQGAINITGGGNAATQDYAGSTASGSLTTATTRLNASSSVLQGNLNTSASALQSNITGVDDKVFTNALGRITKTPSLGSTAGLYLGSANLGYYNGTAWKTYMDNTGLFYLTGSAGGNALLWDGSTLTIKGNLSVGSTVPNSVVSGLGSLALQSSVSTAQVTGLGALATRDNITLSYVTNAGSLAALSSISAAQIDASAVTNAKLATDAVTEGKLAADAVTSGKISANAVVADKIAANAIVADKIAAGAITAAKISAGAIEADKIAAGAITAAKISAGAIEADKIAAGAVTAAKISVADLSALNATIGGWTISTPLLRSTDSITRMDSTNKEFAVMDSDNLNYYRVRIGDAHPTKEFPAGGGFIGTTQLKPFTEIVPSGIRQTAGSSPIDGQILYNVMTSFSSSSGIGNYLGMYGQFTGPTTSPGLYISLTNPSGTSSTNAAIYSGGGAYLRSVTNINQGYALITEGNTYLNLSSGLLYFGSIVNDSANTSGIRIKADGRITRDSSSIRYKKNIKNITDIEANRILNLNVVTYNEKIQKDNDVRMTGIVAEEVDTLGYKDFVAYNEKNQPDNLNYQQIFTSMLYVVQQLEKRITELETQLKNK